MRKIYIVGVAFAAIFAFSMIGASGASAFTLWDQCTKTATPLEFKNSDCTEKVAPFEWGWEEIKVKTSVDSLLTTLTLKSNGIGIDCEGFMDGTVGPGNEDEVILLLNDAEEEVTETKPALCEVLEDPLGLCGGVKSIAEASPDGLPWLTLLEPTGDLLEAGPSGVLPGWLVKCPTGLENLCDKEDTILKVTNLESELEVDLEFNPEELALCTVGGATAGVVEGTVSILLVNGNALRAM